MINIGICDDEEMIRDILKEKIKACIAPYMSEADYLEFSSGEELSGNGKMLDLLFLDIDMPGIDGIEAGKRFRTVNKNCKIVMATARKERIKEAFFLEAYRFIEKPFNENEIREAIDSFMERRIGFQKICLWDRRKKVEVYQYQIILIQTYDSSTEFLVGQEIFRGVKSLRELEEELDDRLFVRIDKKYIVNLKYIEKYEKGIVFIDEKQIKVARRRIRDFEEKYREYDLRFR
jgi:DNA-binding LytR/AlgR family response regulator